LPRDKIQNEIQGLAFFGYVHSEVGSVLA